MRRGGGGAIAGAARNRGAARCCFATAAEAAPKNAAAADRDAQDDGAAPRGGLPTPIARVARVLAVGWAVVPVIIRRDLPRVPEKPRSMGLEDVRSGESRVHWDAAAVAPRPKSRHLRAAGLAGGWAHNKPKQAQDVLGALANPEDSEATYLLAPAPAPSVMDGNWATGARLLLETIKKEKERKSRLKLADLQGTLTSCGFGGTQLLSNNTERGVLVPEHWPKSGKMRRVTELVRYLEGALENVEIPDGHAASTAPAPPSRTQPPPPPRLALPPPPRPRAEPRRHHAVATKPTSSRSRRSRCLCGAGVGAGSRPTLRREMPRPVHELR